MCMCTYTHTWAHSHIHIYICNLSGTFLFDVDSSVTMETSPAVLIAITQLWYDLPHPPLTMILIKPVLNYIFQYICTMSHVPFFYVKFFMSQFFTYHYCLFTLNTQILIWNKIMAMTENLSKCAKIQDLPSPIMHCG